MIEFYGLVGDYCRKHILKKLIKLSIWGGIGMFILFGIPSIIIGIYFDIWIFLILSSMCMIGVIIGYISIGSLDTHTIGIIDIVPCGIVIEHGCKLAAFGPCIIPFSVRKWISNLIIGDRHSVIRS